MFCVFLYGPFCHGAHKLDLSTLFTTFFLWTSPPFILNIDSEVCFDKLKVAEKFNSFYTSVASKVVEKMPKCVKKYCKSFVFNFYSSKGVRPNCFRFSIVTESIFLNILITWVVTKQQDLMVSRLGLLLMLLLWLLTPFHISSTCLSSRVVYQMSLNLLE